METENKEEDYDFLPKVEEKKAGKPRITISDGVCLSCEG